MKKENISDALDYIDFDMVEDAYKSSVNYKSSGHRQWLKWGMAAACLVLVITAAVSLSVFFNSKGKPYTPILINPDSPPDAIIGSPLEFVVGSSTSVGQHVNSAPPDFRFEYMWNFVVKAEFVQALDDVYYMLNVSSDYKPIEYRVLEFRTEEVLQGKNIPEKFYYLIEAYLFVDFSQYDSFIISMMQEGAENYVMRNGTESRMEALSLPVFSDCRGQTELGNMIAFTDGIFDERLWQNESWLYGYQFIRSALDDEEYCKKHEVMYRGCTEEYTKEKILALIREYAVSLGENYTAPATVELSFESEAAKAALLYVKPFENGVFSQSIYHIYDTDRTVVFRRYINGCETDETITINTVTEEVTYSEVRYTDEDMECMEDIGAHIAELSAQYREKRPTPPRTDPTGKNLMCLNLFGWYAKAEGRVYGVIKTVWIYMVDGDWSTIYYDDTYTLFDAKAGYAKTVSREELMDLIGIRNLYRGDYEPIELPQC